MATLLLVPGVEEDAPRRTADADSATAKERLAQVLWDQGIVARDDLGDPIRAGHCFLHAGRLWRQAGRVQDVIDALHAARGVTSIVENTFTHGGPVSSALPSPDGKLLCTCCLHDHSARLWSLESGQLVRVLKHQGGVAGATFAPDGKRLLTRSYDGAVLWDLGQEKPLGVFNPNQGSNVYGIPSGAVFHPDGEHVLTWDRGKIQLWSPQHDAPVIDVPYRGVSGARFHPKTGRLLTWGRDDAAIWDIRQGKLLRAFKHPGPVRQALFDPTLDALVTWSEDEDGSSSTGRVWKPYADEPSHVFGGGHGTNGVQFHPDGQRLLSWGTGNLRTTEAYLWDRSKSHPVRSFPHEEMIQGGLFSPKGETALTWARDGVLKVWSLEKDRLLHVLKHEDKVRGAVFLPESESLAWLVSERIVTWDARGVIKLWPAANPYRVEFRAHAPLRTFRHGAAVRGVLPLGEDRLLTWSDDRTARIWNLTANKPVRKVFRCSQSIGNPPSVTWAGRPPYVLTRSRHKTLTLWSVNRDAPLRTWSADSGISSVQVSPRDELLMTWGQGNLVRLWPLREEGPPRLTYEHPGPVRRAEFAGDGRHVLTADDRATYLWSTSSDKPIRVLPSGPRGNVQLLSDCKRLIGTSEEGPVVLWSIDEDQPTHTFEPGTFLVNPNQREVLISRRDSTNREGTARLWSLDTGRPIREFPLGSGGDRPEFNAEGNLLLTHNSGARRAWLWSVKTGKLLKQFHRRQPGESAFTDNHLVSIRFDPTGKYIVAQGGARYTNRGCTVVWSTDRLDDPLATFDVRGRNLFFHPDGVMLAERHGVLVLSLTGKTEVVRHMTPDQMAIRYMLGNRETGELYTMNMRTELWQWDMTREDPAKLPEMLRDFERRSRMRLDEAGRYCLIENDDPTNRHPDSR